MISERRGFNVVVLVGFFLAVISFMYGCRDSKEEAKDAVRNLLKSAYEKNFEKVRQYVDFDVMLDNSLREQGVGVLEAGERKKVIDEMVKGTGDISRDDYEKALKTLKVDIYKDGYNALATYSTLSRVGITLTLEKRKTGWMITGIQ